MAHLQLIGNRVILELSLWEKLGAFHDSPTIEVNEIESVDVIDNPWSSKYLKGMRAPGTGIPLVVMLGTMRYRGGKDFCAIYKRKPNAIVTLKSGPFKRWIFEIKDMSEIEMLRSALAKN
jgi:hypothetical protein